MAPISIKVCSKARGVNCNNKIFSVDDTSISWIELLKSHKVHLPKHCNFWIRNPSLSIVAIPQESIKHFLDQYKCHMDVYTVTITRANRLTKRQLAERRLQLKVQNNKVTGSKRRLTSRPVESDDPEVDQPAPRLVRYDSMQSRSMYAEDDIGYQDAPMRQEQTYQDDIGFNDAASMFSQESQDDQDDGGLKKHEIIRKIQEQMSNGDLIRIMNEHKELKRRGKIMKIARYVPLTMNFLNFLLDQ